MATQSQIKSIIYNNFIGNYKSEKVNAVAKAASKFINKYKRTHCVSSDFVIDACLQSYGFVSDLDAYLEREKFIFIRK